MWRKPYSWNELHKPTYKTSQGSTCCIESGKYLDGNYSNKTLKRVEILKYFYIVAFIADYALIYASTCSSEDFYLSNKNKLSNRAGYGRKHLFISPCCNSMPSSDCETIINQINLENKWNQNAKRKKSQRKLVAENKNSVMGPFETALTKHLVQYSIDKFYHK